MKRFVLTMSAVAMVAGVYAQETISLQGCYELALQHTPLSGQAALYGELAASKEERLGLAYRPQVSLNGQWSYQSDVFSLPFSIPGAETPEIPKSQYQATVGIEQSIYDGGMVRQSREASKRELAANQQKVEVDLYKVKESVNSLYFGVLRIQEAEKNLEAARNTLLERKKVIDAGFSTGVLLQSDKSAFEKEILTIEQQLVAAEAEKEGLVAMLADKLGQPLSVDAVLTLPGGTIPLEGEATINRPELSYLSEQKTVLSQAGELIAARTKPKVSAFARGGFGSPNPYNFFKTDLSGFYMAGVRLYWPLFDWGASKQERQELQIQEQLLENSRSDAMSQFENGTLQWRKKWLVSDEVMKRDAEIVRLQESIVREYAARLEGGTVTSSDYITALDQLTRAKITARMHEIDKAWYQVQYFTLTGNL
ncbi:TolC family protein [Imperialibacter roseus]|uniref:TolC family protein n=1 Tax=Imperialibacter roseus TaxID=1324217 RepID=A0ABZ0ILS7_9BACT|nr:TolC family protein [Imperialibacter roseus]WOK05454.1 TolC family protein [Imperialibacter roseus]